MERLEKALEKARRMREINIGVPPGVADLLNGANYKVSSAQAQSHFTMSPPILRSAPIDIDEVHLERRRILAHRAKSPEADIFRILRTQVLQIMNKEGYKTLAITSPNYGDGKTTVALNLAMSIALDSKQTALLVDMDLRKPNLHEFLGMKQASGLSDHLIDNTPIPDCLMRLPFDRLSMLPGGRPMDHSSELLGSPKMAALAQEFRTRYADRLIIYDMPPVLAQDDTIAFLPHVDAVLLVIRDEVTTANELQMCMQVLSHANIIGTVLNNAKTA